MRGAGATGSAEPPQGGAEEAGADAADLARLARDWITLWQSELTALAEDREARESWQALISLWAGAAGTLARAYPRASDGHAASAGAPFGHARPTPPPRPPSAAAAPDTRDAEIERLRERLAAVEQRLADYERGAGESRNTAGRAGKPGKR